MEEKKVKVSDEAKREAAKRAAAAKAAAGKKTVTKETAEKKTAPKKTAPKKKAPTREADEEEIEEEIVEEIEAVEEEKPAKKRLEKKVSSDERSTVKKLRTWAIILWVVAILAEIGAFFAFGWAVRNSVSAAEYPAALDRIGAFLNSNLGLTPELLVTLLALVVDAAACIVAAQLWKKSNRISPCLANSALVRTLWHQLGVIMVLVCFVPIGIFLLIKSKGLNKKSRTVILAAALALFLGATASSVDYKQPSKEEVEQLQQEAIAANADGDIFWTRYGKSYHFERDCQAIRGKTLVEDGGTLTMGTLDDAFNANRWDPCDFCAGGGEVIEEAVE